MYTAYGQGYQPALDQYNTLMKENPKFGELLNQYRGGKPLTLEHLLIMPVQRVPRYNLLLSDFLKKTDPSHPDYQDIDLAIKAVEEAAAHMNQTMRKAEQMTRLVQNASAEAVGGLLEASRSLLMDGVFNCDMFSDFPSCVSVAKQNLFTSGGKKTDKMHLFCFNDILVYIKQSEVKQTKDFSKTTTNMHFNLVWVEEKGESLMIRCPNRRLVVHFPTPAEKSKWLTEITNCIFRSLVPYPEGGTPTKTGANPVPPGLRYGEYMWGDGLDISYKGWWLGAHMHTEGAFTCNGNHYEGGFTSGQKQGSGKLTYSTGFVYEGEFNKDFPNGEGKLTSPTKEVYRGTFKDGRMNGHGVLEWPNGDKCTADWENNRACGRAKLLTKSGISYDGEVKDNLPHGNGTVTMGSLYYMGMWEYGERHGQGTMDYGNGIKYEGTWEDDKYHGRGVLTNSQDGSRYEGEFVNGRKCGMGGMKFGNGDRYEGQWKNDAPHGKGEMIYGNKDVYQGTWKSGKHHGTGVFTYENGTKVDGKWTMGQLEGNTKVSPGSNVWNVPKNGIPSVGFGDYAVNTEPLPELPKRLNFSFC
uniref:DH domain-containing protein n=1 Tax=Paramoeba aestuarina TaxID=180227 RepID=A0A7S4P642_9EUKA